MRVRVGLGLRLGLGFRSAFATMMVFVIPHNFLAPIVPKMEVRNRVGLGLGSEPSPCAGC